MATSGECQRLDFSPVSLVNYLLPSNIRSGPGGTQRQATALQNEGVTVVADAMGSFSIDLRAYGWFPKNLEAQSRHDLGA